MLTKLRIWSVTFDMFSKFDRVDRAPTHIGSAAQLGCARTASRAGPITELSCDLS
ncbi:Uncharacterised protein [Mycobacteroides abscessus subsp. abscessus]|nr:Uncharacterised protein [Mycobacteroides abscessus subsp. abscessus]